MRGGSKAAFDGDQILKVEKFPDYKENNVYANKNVQFYTRIEIQYFFTKIGG